jgi:molecular chaperone GrpE
VTAKKIHPKDAEARTQPDTPETAAAAKPANGDAPVAEASSGEILSAEAAAELNSRIEQAEARAAEFLDSLQRERATFQNYKKRVERERAEQSQAAAGAVLVKLLPTLDDFYRAMDAVPADQRNQWFEGVALILRKFERFLKDEGVVEIEAQGQPFDPAQHEAIGLDGSTDAESGTITQVLQRGYRHGERVLRPAMVRVAE